MPILSSFLPCEQPGRVLGDDERGLAAVAELGVDGGDDDVHVGDAAVGDEDLGAVEDPLVAVELGGGAQRLDVGAGAGLGDGVGAELDLVALAEALGHPAADLLGRAGGGDAGGGQRGGGDGERDAGAAPVQLLGVDHAEQAVGVGAHLLDVLEAVQVPLAGGLDGLPGHGLLAVVLGGDGRMTSAAKRRQCCWNSSCSSLSLKSTVLPPDGYGVSAPVRSTVD